MGRKRDVHHTVEQEQYGTVIFQIGIEVQLSARTAVTISSHLRGKGNGRTGFFRAGGDVEGMQALKISAVFLGFAHHVKSIRGGVDHRSSCDANFGIYVISADITVGDGSGSRPRSMR